MEKSFKIHAAYPVRVIDVAKGVYDASKKTLTTIYGENVHDVVIVATIMKTEYTPASGPDKKSRLKLDIDDGTAVVNATLFEPTEEMLDGLSVGDIIVLLAYAREFENKITLSIRHVRKITKFSEELYHRARVAKKLSMLVANGKPLILEDGGRITNKPDKASRIFSEDATTDLPTSEIEKPLSVNLKDGDEEDIGFSFIDIGADEAGKVEPADSILDDEIVKTTIMTTISMSDAGALSFSEIAEMTAFEESILKRVLKIMVNEKTLTKLSDNPEKYSM